MEARISQKIHINADGTTTPTAPAINPQTIGGIEIGDGIQEYYITTEATLTGNCSITSSLTPFVGVKYRFHYIGTCVYDGTHVVTILGRQLTPLEQVSSLIIEAEYGVDGTASFTYVVYAMDSPSVDLSGSDNVTLVAGGGTIYLVPGANNRTQVMTGSATLVASYNFTNNPALGAPATGTKWTIYYLATMTLSGNGISFFGTSLTAAQALAGSLTIIAEYNGSAWKVIITQGTPNFATQKVGVTTTATVAAQGNIALTSGTSNQTLELTGSPTLVNSYSITGTAVNNGDWFEVYYKATTTVGTNTITIFGYTLSTQEALFGNTYVRATWNGSVWITAVTTQQPGQNFYTTKLQVTSAQISDLNGTPLSLVPAQGANTIIRQLGADGYLTWNANAYTTHTQLDLVYTGQTTSFLKNTTLLVAVANLIDIFIAGSQTTEFANTGVSLYSSGGNPAAGDSPVNIYFHWFILNI